MAAAVDEIVKKLNEPYERVKKLYSILLEKFNSDEDLFVKKGRHTNHDYFITLIRNKKHIDAIHIHFYIKDSSRLAWHYSNHNVRPVPVREPVRDPTEPNKDYYVSVTGDEDIESIFQIIKNTLTTHSSQEDTQGKRKKSYRKKLYLKKSYRKKSYRKKSYRKCK